MGWGRGELFEQQFFESILLRAVPAFQTCCSDIKVPKVKTMLKLPWPLVKVSLRILGLIGRGTTYFVQNKTTIILPGDTRRTYGRVAMPDEGDKCFGAKLEA